MTAGHGTEVTYMLTRGPHSRTMTTTTLALLCLFTLNLATATEVYKWVDQDGITHYSARPPVDERGYEQLNIHSRRYEPIPNSSVAANTNDQANDGQNSADNSDDVTQPGAEVVVKNREKIAQNCERARSNISTINNRRRVMLNDENGEPRRMTDDERTALLRESQNYLDEWCDDN